MKELDIMLDEIYDVWAFHKLVEIYSQEKDGFFIDELKEFNGTNANQKLISNYLAEEVVFLQEQDLSINEVDTFNKLFDRAQDDFSKSTGFNIKSDFDKLAKRSMFIEQLKSRSNGVGTYPYYKFNKDKLREYVLSLGSNYKLSKELSESNCYDINKRNKTITSSISNINKKIDNYKKRKESVVSQESAQGNLIAIIKGVVVLLFFLYVIYVFITAPEFQEVVNDN